MNVMRPDRQCAGQASLPASTVWVEYRIDLCSASSVRSLRSRALLSSDALNDEWNILPFFIAYPDIAVEWTKRAAGPQPVHHSWSDARKIVITFRITHSTTVSR